jgi:hypothetical protein
MNILLFAAQLNLGMMVWAITLAGFRVNYKIWS